MTELWDIYDENRRKTGKIAERDVYKFKKGEYHIVVTGIIFNTEHKILISKRAGGKSMEACGNAIVVLFWQEKQA